MCGGESITQTFYYLYNRRDGLFFLNSGGKAMQKAQIYWDLAYTILRIMYINEPFNRENKEQPPGRSLSIGTAIV